MASFIDVGPGLDKVSFKDIITDGIRHNDLVHDMNKPWTGNNGTSTNNAYRIGRITAPADPASNGSGPINRFFFHYNPQSVTIGSQSDPTVRPQDQMSAAKVFTDITNTENMSFDFLLNRIPDVALRNGTKWNAAAEAYGTLHDLYYLYGLINRNFTDPALKSYDYPNTDTGLLLPYPIVVIFGELFRFTGQVMSLSVQHAKFIASPLSSQTSAPLIPVLTNVSMSLRRTPNGLNMDDSASNDSSGDGGGLGAPDKPGAPGHEPGQTSSPPPVTLPGPGHGSPGDTTTPPTEVPGG